MSVPRPTNRTATAMLLVAVLVNGALLWYFHDRFWYAADEGNYAHVAERVLDGEVLHRDIQDLHPGYINFVNAGAFALFGVDLVSLRYPLAAVSFLQALAIWILLARRNLVLATVASIASTAVGVVQFLNPTAHWYSLAVTVLLIAWLGWVPRTHAARTFGAGVLVGVVILFRQLTGVWVGMSVLLVLLLEHATDARGRDAVLARGSIVAMAVVLLAYLALAGGPEATGILFLASWPLAILGLAAVRPAATNRTTLSLVSGLALGMGTAALPLVAYHAVHGSLGAWWHDTVAASLTLTTLPFFQGATFALLPLAGALQVVSPLEPVALVNGLYWVALPLLPVVNGILTVRWLGRAERDTPVLPVVACFYSLVTLHLAGAVYLSYTVGLTTAAVLWFAAHGPRRTTLWVAGATASLAVVAVVFHAGQSTFRSRLDTARGVRTFTADTPTCPPTPRSSLRVEWRECDAYRRLALAIDSETATDDRILAVPSDAELYFLADRRNQFRFFNTAIGIGGPEDLAAVMRDLADRPPRLVTYRPEDKYNDDASRVIMDYVRSRYEHFDTIGGVELYRLRDRHHLESE